MIAGPAAVCGLLLLGNGAEFSRPLVGHWKLVRYSGYGVMILKTEEGSTAVQTLIGPEVERYSVRGTIITGYVKARAPRDREDTHRPTTGYFVVDTTRDAVWEGLDDKDWKRRLEELGVGTPPDLSLPILR